MNSFNRLPKLFPTLWPKQCKKEQLFPFVVVQLIHRLMQADISCTTTAHLFFFPLLVRDYVIGILLSFLLKKEANSWHPSLSWNLTSLPRISRRHWIASSSLARHEEEDDEADDGDEEHAAHHGAHDQRDVARAAGSLGSHWASFFVTTGNIKW